MANFNEAFEKVIANEGGYVNDANDPGGETYKGISRKMHSGWIGWHIVDLLKKQNGFPALLDQNVELQSEIKQFYQIQFWDRISGNLIADQAVANSIFDFAVNAGTTTSATLAQMTSGIKIDGIIGPKTAEAINNIPSGNFLASFTLAKIARYIHIVKKRPVSRKYFFGWVCRALDENIYKAQ